MVSVGVTRIGKTWVVFIDRGAKANSSYYCNIVLKTVCCLTSEQYVVIYRWTLQQDGAPAHTAQTTIDYPKNEHINFIEPHMWLPNSHDINPVDYAIWGALRQRVYHQRQFKTVEELKRAIVTEWQKFSQRFIDNSVNEWRQRPETVIKNGGGHIEHCNLA